MSIFSNPARLRYNIRIRSSFNGRTAVSKTANDGSIPSDLAKPTVARPTSQRRGDSYHPCRIASNCVIIGLVINILKSKEFLNRIFMVIFLVLGFLLSNPWKIIFIILSGIASGLYYGCYNDIIWRPNSETKLSTFPHYRAHQMWIHIFCSLVGSIALYYLITLINFDNPGQILEKFGFNTFILAFVAIMGYVGLLPRLLWYTTYGLGQFGKPPGK